MTKIDSEKILREIRIVLGAILIGTATYQVIELPNRIGQYVDNHAKEASARVKPILDNVIQLSSTSNTFARELSKDYYDPDEPDQGLYWDIRNVLDRSSESSFASSRLVARLDSQINGGADPKTGLLDPGLIPTAVNLLADLNGVALAAKGSLAKMDGALTPLPEILDNITNVAKNLESQLAVGGNIDLAFARLAISVSDFNSLLENEDIQKTLANTANGTKSLANSAETLDIVMQPWRKKAGQLKAILKTLVNMLKITVPLPF